MGMRAGKLRHRVTAQRQVTTSNDYGEVEHEWRDLGCTRASIEPLRATETYSGGIEVSETHCRIKMRYSPKLCSLTGSDRLVCGNDVYDIVAPITPWEMNREMVVLCTRRPMNANEGRCNG